MIKSKFAILIDSIFFGFIIFLLLYFWLYKIIKINTLSFTLSFVFSIIFIIIFYILSNKNRNKTIKNKSDKDLFNQIKNNLKYSKINDSIIFFEKLLNIKYIGNNIFENENNYFYINFFNSLNCYDFIISNNFYLQSNKLKPLHFLCDNVSDEFKNLIDNSLVKYKVFLYNDIFEIMKKKDIYPTNIKLSKMKNNNLNNIKSNIVKTLNSIKFKDCFLSGIALCFLSIIVPFSLYYLIMGSIFLILSIISLIIKSIKIKENYIQNKTNLIDILNNK